MPACPRLLPALLLSTALLAAPPKGKAPAQAQEPQGPRVDAARLVALKARSIGPAVMGGRVSDIAVAPDNPDTFYIGLATGGVWKTVNAGATFSPIFDKEPLLSIGAVAAAPSDPKVLWVGTGEANDRNTSGWGNGVYRSTDGGATWTHVGLDWSRAIPRIVVSPADPATAYVAVMGDLWNPGGERGLFKTTDGGKTWKAVLKAPDGLDTRVGCGDVALDPADPNTIYAALYARRRTPRSFTLRARRFRGQGCGRHLPEPGWRRHLAEAREGPARPHRPHRAGRLARRPEAGHGGGAERCGRHHRH